MNDLSKDELFYHIRVKPEEVGKFVLMPGDPDRVPVIAKFLERPRMVVSHREFTVYDGFLDDELVTVISTGIGAPSAAIVVEEVCRAGASTLIRVGTCGAVAKNVKLGDLVIATSAIRMDGTSKHYVAPEYPASASIHVSLALACAAQNLGYRYHLGIAASTDSFYVGQGRHGFGGYRSQKSKELLEEMRRVRALCFEMESSAIFTLANIYGLRAGAVLVAVATKVKDRFRKAQERRVSQTAVEAVRILIEWDKEAKRRGLPFWLPYIS